MQINVLLIGDKSGRRIKAFADCLKELDIHSFNTMDWLEVIKDPSMLQKSFKENTLIKIEPPEKNMAIYRELLLLGQAEQGLCEKEIKEIDFSCCPIIAPAQWYRGFQKTLAMLQEVCRSDAYKKISFMNDFQETLSMMDKRKTYHYLADQAASNRFYLPPKIEAPASYQEFKERYGSKVLRCFIKLRYGSGGTGVIAYQSHPKFKEERIWTSLNYEQIRGRKIFYSNHKVHSYSDQETVQEMIDWVLQQGAHIEQWVPKATVEELSFDIRAFVLNKKAEYLLARLSKSPITNLHLGNQRRESGQLLAKEQEVVISHAAEAVMGIFQQSLYAGIDIVCSKGYKPYVIDVNPFGDLFHHLLERKENVYYLEIKQAMEKLRGEINDC